MNKHLKLACLLAILGSSNSIYAQYKRINILEQFTSAYCGPCAQANPGLARLILKNEEKIFLVKYQHTIPKADPMYLQNKRETDVRANYYSVNFNPFGSVNGAVLSPGNQYPNHVNYATQSMIDGLPTTSAFEIVVNVDLNNAKDSVIATVKINCGKDFGDAEKGSLKLHGLLLEDIHFDQAPGSNGEKDFEQVVRKMYPSELGTLLPATWTSGSSETFTLSGPVPPYVDVTKGNLKFAVFIQDDKDKAVEQAVLIGISGTTTTIKTLANNSNALIYPNPVKHTIYVSTERPKAGKVHWNLLTIEGREISQGELYMKSGNNTFEIPVATTLPEGIYLMRMESENEYWIQKFIKQ